MADTDLDHARSFTYTAEAATWTFWCISTVLVGLKGFSRYYFNYKTEIREDLIIAVSWVLTVCRQAFYQKGLTSIREIHTYDVESRIPTAAFWIFFSDYWFYISSPPPKLAIALVLNRIFEPRKWLRRGAVVFCIFFFILGVIGLFVSMFECSPPPAQWDPDQYPDAHCYSMTVVTGYTAAFAIIGGLMDFAFAIYPVVVIWNLRLPIWKRIGTAAIMSVGIISGVLCMIKLIWLAPLHGNVSVYDKLYDGSILGIFCAIENDIIVSAACLPFASSVFRAWKPYIHKYTGWFGTTIDRMSRSNMKTSQFDRQMTANSQVTR